MYIHLLTISILGISLLWSLRLVYGRRRHVSDDLPVLIITQAAWILIYLGVGMVFGPVVLIVALIVSAMAVAQYRNSERRALLWALAISAEYGVPLIEAARSFAKGRIDEMGRRSYRLAECLEGGMPLAAAMRASRNPLPRDADLAMQLGYATDSLSDTLRDAAVQSNRVTASMQANFSAILYFVIATGFMVLVVTFVCIRIVPTYETIMADFGTEVPWITRYFMQAANLIGRYAVLLVPVALLLLAIWAYGVAGYMGFRVPHLPVLGSFQGDATVILRTLGSCVRQGRPILESIDLLAHWYPENQIGARLALVAQEIRQGAHWCDSLLKRRLIRHSDAAVLKAAERVGNLEWACFELSDAMSRRSAYRAAAFSRLLGPLLALVIGVPIAVFAVAIMAPVIQLTENLTY